MGIVYLFIQVLSSSFVIFATISAKPSPLSKSPVTAPKMWKNMTAQDYIKMFAPDQIIYLPKNFSSSPTLTSESDEPTYSTITVTDETTFNEITETTPTVTTTEGASELVKGADQSTTITGKSMAETISMPTTRNTIDSTIGTLKYTSSYTTTTPNAMTFPSVTNASKVTFPKLDKDNKQTVPASPIMMQASKSTSILATPQPTTTESILSDESSKEKILSLSDKSNTSMRITTLRSLFTPGYPSTISTNGLTSSQKLSLSDKLNTSAPVTTLKSLVTPSYSSSMSTNGIPSNQKTLSLADKLNTSVQVTTLRSLFTSYSPTMPGNGITKDQGKLKTAAVKNPTDIKLLKESTDPDFKNKLMTQNKSMATYKSTTKETTEKALSTVEQHVSSTTSEPVENSSNDDDTDFTTVTTASSIYDESPTKNDSDTVHSTVSPSTTSEESSSNQNSFWSNGAITNFIDAIKNSSGKATNKTGIDYGKFNTKPGTGITVAPSVSAKPLHPSDDKNWTKQPDRMSTAMLTSLILMIVFSVVCAISAVFAIQWYRHQRSLEDSIALMSNRHGQRRPFYYYDSTM